MEKPVNNSSENIEKPKARFLLIDDHKAIVEGAGFLFDKFTDFTAAECHSAEEALGVILDHMPEVIFLDHSLTKGGSEGLEVAKVLSEKYPDIKIYSTTTNPYFEEEYKKLGISHIEKGDTEGIKAVITRG
jgi:CheY-like chemotaxis protein